MIKKTSIILIDEKSDFTEIEKTSGEKIIITFDYFSHEKLLMMKINHKISDDYLLKEELNSIIKKSREFSYWFRDEKIKKNLEYKNVNLGQVYYPEFHNLLIPFLKKFFEIKEIVGIHNGEKFIASGNLANLLNLFLHNNEKINQKEIASKFLYDSYKIPIKLFGKNFSVNLSRTNYKKLKKFLDGIIKILFDSSNKNHSENSILLIECDVIKYRKLFEELPKHNLNLMILNRRKPIVWNKTSYSILRKSKCHILTNKSIDDKYENFANNEISNITKKIEFLKNHTFFEKFFSINQISFWQVLRPIFFELMDKRIKEAVEEIEIINKLIENFKFKSIVIWSEHGFNEQIVIQLAKKFNIKIILVQHGVYHDSKDSYEMNEFQGVLPTQSNLFFVWGKSVKNYSLSCGIDEEKIIEVGSPVHDLTCEQIKNMNSENILLALPPFTENIVEDLLVETIEKYKIAIKKIYEVCKNNNKKLVIKTHPAISKISLDEFIKKIDSNIVLVKSGNIVDLIKTCSMLVTIDVSTAILDAQILKKPVIMILIKDIFQTKSEIVKSNSFIDIKNINEFEKLYLLLISDSNYRNEQIIRQSTFLHKYLSNLGSSSQKFLNYLENIQHT